MRQVRTVSRIGLFAAFASLVAALLTTLLGPARTTQAAFVEGGKGPQALFGRDDDNLDNPLIQPPGVAANQSLNNADLLEGGPQNDVLVGLLGSDTMLGGPGHDILVGGTEQGTQPNSDIMTGGPGNDVSVWAGGDGSDAFVGGPGLDAQVFGTIDRVSNIPTLSNPTAEFPFGVPTANVSGQGGFCTLEAVTDPAFGYDFLVRFFSRATGNLLVTVRVKETEQVFCTSVPGGAITYADLTQPSPAFVEVSLAEVQALNPIVGLIAR